MNSPRVCFCFTVQVRAKRPQAATRVSCKPTCPCNVRYSIEGSHLINVVPKSQRTQQQQRGPPTTNDLRPNGKYAPTTLRSLFCYSRAGLAGLRLEGDEIVLWGGQRENRTMG